MAGELCLMLIFINKEKDTYFAVNNETSGVICVTL